jgi:glyoxylase I family protein
MLLKSAFAQPGSFHVKGLNHFAWRCKDAEQTRQFYEGLLGLPLAHTVIEESVPSTGQACAFAHIFFRMGDGSFIAFFDLGDNQPAVPDPATPSWVNHISLEVQSEAQLTAAKDRLQAAGVDVLGVTDHHWLKSIYFFDPNGIRLELCWRALGQDYLDDCEKQAHKRLQDWTQAKLNGRHRAPG